MGLILPPALNFYIHWRSSIRVCCCCCWWWWWWCVACRHGGSGQSPGICRYTYTRRYMYIYIYIYILSICSFVRTSAWLKNREGHLHAKFVWSRPSASPNTCGEQSLIFYDLCISTVLCIYCISIKLHMFAAILVPWKNRIHWCIGVAEMISSLYKYIALSAIIASALTTRGYDSLRREATVRWRTAMVFCGDRSLLDLGSPGTYGFIITT